MKSVLIVEPSDSLRNELAKELKKDYLTYCCANGDDGLRLQSRYHPDGLVVNLILYNTDGLFLLEHMDKPYPKAVITLSAIYPPYVLQKLINLDVSYSFLVPCSVFAVSRRVRDILEQAAEVAPTPAQEIIANCLRKLNAPHWGGFEDLIVGVPLFAQDPAQSITKELYPAIASLRGRSNWQQVEKAIRDMKDYVYLHRNDDIWKEYFPDSTKCPTNKQFISRLSDFLK